MAETTTGYRPQGLGGTHEAAYAKPPWYKQAALNLQGGPEGGWEPLMNLLAGWSRAYAQPTAAGGLGEAAGMATEFAKAATAQRKIAESRKLGQGKWDELIQYLIGSPTAEGEPGPDGAKLDKKGDGTSTLTLKMPSQIKEQMSDESAAAMGATPAETQMSRAISLRESLPYAMAGRPVPTGGATPAEAVGRAIAGGMGMGEGGGVATPIQRAMEDPRRAPALQQ